LSMGAFYKYSMLENCFLPLPNIPLLDQVYVDEVFSAEFPNPLHFAESKNGHVNRIPSTFTNNQLCIDLRNHFGVDVFAEYYRNEPNSFHNWHCDAIRSSSVNYLINSVPSSFALFGKKIADSHFITKECDYTLRQATLFNTKMLHSIVNNSTQYRYVLSVTIGTKNNAVPFELAKLFLINYKSHLTIS